MSDKHLPLKTLEEIEGKPLFGLVDVLLQEGLDAVRYILWDATDCHRYYTVLPPGVTGQRKSVSGWVGRWR